jgi:hypothetical protein
VGLGARQRRKLNAAEHKSAGGTLPEIAVAHARDLPQELGQGGYTYWALGGRATRKTAREGRSTAHWPGTPQGRHPRQRGARGCTLVECDGSHVRLQPLATSAARWHTEMLDIAPGTSPGELRDAALARLDVLAAAARGGDLLVTWLVRCAGMPSGRLRFAAFRAELAAELNRRCGYTRPAIWNLSIDLEPPVVNPPAESDATLLGEYLRAAAQWIGDESLPLDLAQYLPQEQGQAGLQDGRLAQLLAIDAPGRRQRVLRQAAALGAELLRGDSQP